jgi:Concanavalin A-like lectin/glucanases superfamily
MALTRPLAGVVLVSALVAGCSQSLFGNPDDGRPDGGPGPGVPDGSVILDDAGNVIRPDANPDLPPDAAVPGTCPARCLGDAVAEFAADQGGTSGAWGYFEELPDPLGIEHREIAWGEVDGLQGWVSPSAPTLALASCPANRGAPQCVGIEDKLVFMTTSNAAGALHPSITWQVPYTGTFRLSGAWRSPDGTPSEVAHVLLIARASRSDGLFYQRFLSSSSSAAFDFEVDLVQDELIRLSVFADSPSGEPVGLSFYISEGQGAGSCQMAPLFQGNEGPFPDQCTTGSGFLDNVGSTFTCADTPCPATVEAVTPLGSSGARQLVEGSSMQYQGPPNDYSGDWTVQFWAKLDGGGIREQWLLSDFDCDNQGGVAVYYDLVDLYFELIHEDPEVDYCGGAPVKFLSIPAPTADSWHFFRMVRDQDAGVVNVCMDGVRYGEIPVPPEARMPTFEPMHLGRSQGRLAYLRGTLHDLRVLSQALPCPSVP